MGFRVHSPPSPLSSEAFLSSVATCVLSFLLLEGHRLQALVRGAFWRRAVNPLFGKRKIYLAPTPFSFIVLLLGRSPLLFQRPFSSFCVLV